MLLKIKLLVVYLTQQYQIRIIFSMEKMCLGCQMLRY